MSSTYSDTGSQTFTRTHAKRISYRVATDLKRMQRLYGRPTDGAIEEFELGGCPRTRKIIVFLKLNPL